MPLILGKYIICMYQIENLSSHCIMASSVPPIKEEQRKTCDDLANGIQQKEESNLASPTSHEDVPEEPIPQPTDGANKTSTSTSRDPSSTENRLRPAAGTEYLGYIYIYINGPRIHANDPDRCHKPHHLGLQF